jgi:hypothetical protein
MIKFSSTQSSKCGGSNIQLNRLTQLNGPMMEGSVYNSLFDTSILFLRIVIGSGENGISKVFTAFKQSFVNANVCTLSERAAIVSAYFFSDDYDVRSYFILGNFFL